jgi:hypothetical protein
VRIVRLACLLLGAWLLLPRRARAGDDLHWAFSPGIGLGHELAAVDVELRWRQLVAYVPVGPFGIVNFLNDRALTAALGFLWIPHETSGLVLALHEIAVWTPKSARVSDSGFEISLAPTIGARLRFGRVIVDLGVGPVVSYSSSSNAPGWTLRSFPHRLNPMRSWPLEADVGVGFEL